MSRQPKYWLISNGRTISKNVSMAAKYMKMNGRWAEATVKQRIVWKCINTKTGRLKNNTKRDEMGKALKNIWQDIPHSESEAVQEWGVRGILNTEGQTIQRSVSTRNTKEIVLFPTFIGKKVVRNTIRSILKYSSRLVFVADSRLYL